MGISENRADVPVPGRAKPDHAVMIVGTGFAGLCMAIKLKEDGCDDLVIIERGDSVGGTWRDNRYPGAACDVPSHLYSFSFAPKTDWSRKYPSQPELYAYLRAVAERYDLLPKIRFNCTLTGAEYDEAAQFWRVSLRGDDGVTATRSARVLVMGNGGLAEPRLPEIPGVNTFKGHSFHSSGWDHDYNLAGKRVAVIGTGASSIQFVPEIAPKAARLDIYQRTPNWIIPRPDRPFSSLEKGLLAFPLLRRLYRGFIYWSHEARVVGLVLNPSLMKLFQKIAEAHIARQVKDPELKSKVTPDYVIGCKRVLISNDWYPAVSRRNVDLVTDGIREVREHAVVTCDGQVREVDCIIYGTGFYATENPIGAVVRGRGGVSLAQAWSQGEEAYLGTLVKGFPNLFLIVGPNTGVGHTSMVYMIESQVALIRRLIAKIDERHNALEVRPQVQDAFNQRLQQRLAGSIWSTGCRSWYRHRSGKITALWPGFTFDFRRQTRKVDARDYTLEQPTIAV